MLAAVCLSAVLASHSLASAQTKKLKLYYLHTGEKATITFKKNGRFLPSGLKKINWHLRDWRRNEPTKMDPQLLDLVWEAYRQSGSKGYIHVISGYRSPASNNLLRKRGRGVAKNSQHTKGKALDFFLPDVKLSKLRAIGLKMGVGGVGYYPKSGSPFVHFDTGSVRHWPRMSRRELVKVFPKGDTMHVPTDGKPLARYKQAVAAYKRKKASGTLVPKATKSPSGGSLFARLTNRNNSDDESESAGSAQAPRKVKTTPKPAAPKPAPEPEIAEPVEPKPEFASLPKNVPVPVIAPRGELTASGTDIVVAAADPAPEPVVEPVTDPAPEPVDPAETDPALARDETIEAAETAESAIASLTVPVPAPRPEAETASESAPAVDDTQADAQATTELALVNPTPAPSPANTPSRGTLVAALTPSEIEDLRSRVRSTIGATGTSPTPALQAPVPAAAIPTASPEPAPVVEANSPQTQLAVVDPAPKAESTTPEITTASLESPKPAAEEQNPIGIEPGVKALGILPIPARNPIEPVPSEPAQTETAALEIAEPVDAAEEGLTKLALANIPLPIRNPVTLEARDDTKVDEQSPVTMASLEEPEAPAPTPTAKPVQRPQLAKRTISLDRYSAPQENSTSIGKFALATNTTIRELADVRAPAYGRNVIRQVPKIILVQGFNLQPFGPGKNNFSGKAVTAMKFESQRIN